VAAPVGEVTPFALGERLIRLRHGIDLLGLRFAREAAAFASTDEAVAQSSTSTIDWIPPPVPDVGKRRRPVRGDW
jgi:hypothetical protein